MNNPFNKGDKVTTKIKGQAFEAIVTQTFNNEVQVRTADKKLHWRVVKTVTLVEAAPAVEPSDPATGESPAEENGALDAPSPPSAQSEEVVPQADDPPAQKQPSPYNRNRSRRNRRPKI